MFLLTVRKSGLLTLLVHELLCGLFYPTNGRPSLKEDIGFDDEDQEEVHQDNVQNEDLYDEENEKEKAESPLNEEESKDDPCSWDKDHSLSFRCMNIVECCVTAQCRDDVKDPKKCQEIYDAANKYQKIYESSKGVKRDN